MVTWKISKTCQSLIHCQIDFPTLRISKTRSRKRKAVTEERQVLAMKMMLPEGSAKLLVFSVNSRRWKTGSLMANQTVSFEFGGPNKH